MLTLNRFNTLFWCSHYRLWTCKYCQGTLHYNEKKQLEIVRKWSMTLYSGKGLSRCWHLVNCNLKSTTQQEMFSNTFIVYLFFSIQNCSSHKPNYKKVLEDPTSKCSPQDVCSGKICSENMQQICRRTHMPKCDFNKVALQLYWNYTSHKCSAVNLLHIFRTPFYKEHLWWAASALSISQWKQLFHKHLWAAVFRSNLQRRKVFRTLSKI